MCCEERHSGQKNNVGLLFIVPDKSKETLWRKCRVSEDGGIDASFLGRIPSDGLERQIRNLDEFGCSNATANEGNSVFGFLLDRLRLATISWAELDKSMAEIMGRADPEAPGDQTLINLLEGFRAQMAEQKGTGV